MLFMRAVPLLWLINILVSCALSSNKYSWIGGQVVQRFFLGSNTKPPAIAGMFKKINKVSTVMTDNVEFPLKIDEFPFDSPITKSKIDNFYYTTNENKDIFF